MIEGHSDSSQQGLPVACEVKPPDCGSGTKGHQRAQGAGVRESSLGLGQFAVKLNQLGQAVQLQVTHDRRPVLLGGGQ